MTWLADLEGLLAKMTPRPWERDDGTLEGYAAFIFGGPRNEQEDDVVGDILTEADTGGLVVLRNRAPELVEAVKALAEIHEYHCGCDEPGSLVKCVAEPIAEFAALKSLKATDGSNWGPELGPEWGPGGTDTMGGGG